MSCQSEIKAYLKAAKKMTAMQLIDEGKKLFREISYPRFDRSPVDDEEKTE